MQLTQLGQKLLLVDLRAPGEYAAARVRGAVSIPAAELAGRMSDIPRTGRVVLYCGCPPGSTIDADAFQLLRDNGFRNISVLTGGFSAWAKQGLPLEGKR